MKITAEMLAEIMALMRKAKLAGNPDETAMVVATASKTGKVSSRTLLLKGLSLDGFQFFTNLKSRKGRDLLENPQASLTFFWPEIAAQLQVEGRVEQISETAADKYFASRPRGSQIGAWASKQSEPLQGRELLEQRVAEMTAKYQDQEVPRPSYWSGFVLEPRRLEFWQGRPYRLHDRQVFTATDNGWQECRLYP